MKDGYISFLFLSKNYLMGSNGRKLKLKEISQLTESPMCELSNNAEVFLTADSLFNPG